MKLLEALRKDMEARYVEILENTKAKGVLQATK